MLWAVLYHLGLTASGKKSGNDSGVLCQMGRKVLASSQGWFKNPIGSQV